MNFKQQINLLVLEEKFDEALKKIEEELEKNPLSADMIRAKTRVLLAAGNVEKALANLDGDAVKIPEILFYRCELLASLGRKQEVINLFEKEFGTDRRNYPDLAVKLLVEIFESDGEIESAYELACNRPEIFETSWLERLKRLAQAQNGRRSSLLTALEEAAVTEIFCNSEALAEILYRRYLTRTDIYAVQKRFQDGRFGYLPVYEALSPEIVRQHLKGEKTLGCYLLDKNSMTRLLCIDIDIKSLDQNADEATTVARVSETATKLQVFAAEIIKSFAAAGLQLYPEKSGFKGLHLWGFFAEPVPARLVRLIARTVLDKIPMPGEFNIDLFPGQDYLSGKGFGNLIKIPLGIHRKTGSRALFLHPSTFETIVRPVAFLEAVRLHDNEEIKKIVNAIVKSEQNQVAETIPSSFCEKEKPVQTARQFPEKLPEQVERVFAGCPLLYKLLVKIRTGVRPTTEEAHVLAYILKPLGPAGEESFHRLLGTLPGYDAVAGHLKLKNVADCLISCRRVRMRLGSIAGTVNCDCHFPDNGASYPSPLLYAGLKPELPGGEIWKDRHAGQISGNGRFFPEKLAEETVEKTEEKLQITIH